MKGNSESQEDGSMDTLSLQKRFFAIAHPDISENLGALLIDFTGCDILNPELIDNFEQLFEDISARKCTLDNRFLTQTEIAQCFVAAIQSFANQLNSISILCNIILLGEQSLLISFAEQQLLDLILTSQADIKLLQHPSTLLSVLLDCRNLHRKNLSDKSVLLDASVAICKDILKDSLLYARTDKNDFFNTICNIKIDHRHLKEFLDPKGFERLRIGLTTFCNFYNPKMIPKFATNLIKICNMIQEREGGECGIYDLFSSAFVNCRLQVELILWIMEAERSETVAELATDLSSLDEFVGMAGSVDEFVDLISRDLAGNNPGTNPAGANPAGTNGPINTSSVPNSDSHPDRAATFSTLSSLPAWSLHRSFLPTSLALLHSTPTADRFKALIASSIHPLLAKALLFRLSYSWASDQVSSQTNNRILFNQNKLASNQQLKKSLSPKQTDTSIESAKQENEERPILLRLCTTSPLFWHLSSACLKCLAVGTEESPSPNLFTFVDSASLVMQRQAWLLLLLEVARHFDYDISVSKMLVRRYRDELESLLKSDNLLFSKGVLELVCLCREEFGWSFMEVFGGSLEIEGGRNMLAVGLLGYLRWKVGVIRAGKSATQSPSDQLKDGQLADGQTSSGQTSSGHLPTGQITTGSPTPIRSPMAKSSVVASPTVRTKPDGRETRLFIPNPRSIAELFSLLSQLVEVEDSLLDLFFQYNMLQKSLCQYNIILLKLYQGLERVGMGKLENSVSHVSEGIRGDQELDGLPGNHVVKVAGLTGNSLAHPDQQVGNVYGYLLLCEDLDSTTSEVTTLIFAGEMHSNVLNAIELLSYESGMRSQCILDALLRKISNRLHQVLGLQFHKDFCLHSQGELAQLMLKLAVFCGSLLKIHMASAHADSIVVLLRLALEAFRRQEHCLIEFGLYMFASMCNVTAYPVFAKAFFSEERFQRLFPKCAYSLSQVLEKFPGGIFEIRDSRGGSKGGSDDQASCLCSFCPPAEGEDQMGQPKYLSICVREMAAECSGIRILRRERAGQPAQATQQAGPVPVGQIPVGQPQASAIATAIAPLAPLAPDHWLRTPKQVSESDLLDHLTSGIPPPPNFHLDSVKDLYPFQLLAEDLVSQGYMEYVLALVFRIAVTSASSQPECAQLLQTLGNRLLDEMARFTSGAIQTLLKLVHILRYNLAFRRLLRMSGTWLGLVTVGRNKPLLAKHLDLKKVVNWACEKGILSMVIPLVCRVMENVAKSKIFRVPNPWTASVLNMLGEVARAPNVRASITCEVSTLFSSVGYRDDSDGVGATSSIRLSEEDQSGWRDDIWGGKFKGKLPQLQKEEVLVKLVLTGSGGIPPEHLRQILFLAIQRIYNDVGPMVERSVMAAVAAVGELVRKDFGSDAPVETVRGCIASMLSGLSSSLVNVQLKEVLAHRFARELAGLFELSNGLEISPSTVNQLAVDNLGLLHALLEEAAQPAKLSEEIVQYWMGHRNAIGGKSSVDSLVEVYRGFGRLAGDRCHARLPEIFCIPMGPISLKVAVAKFEEFVVRLREALVALELNFPFELLPSFKSVYGGENMALLVLSMLPRCSVVFSLVQSVSILLQRVGTAVGVEFGSQIGPGGQFPAASPPGHILPQTTSLASGSAGLASTLINSICSSLTSGSTNLSTSLEFEIVTAILASLSVEALQASPSPLHSAWLTRLRAEKPADRATDRAMDRAMDRLPDRSLDRSPPLTIRTFGDLISRSRNRLCIELHPPSVLDYGRVFLDFVKASPKSRSEFVEKFVASISDPQIFKLELFELIRDGVVIVISSRETEALVQGWCSLVTTLIKATDSLPLRLALTCLDSAVHQYVNSGVQQYGNSGVQQYPNSMVQQYGNSAAQQYAKRGEVGLQVAAMLSRLISELEGRSLVIVANFLLCISPSEVAEFSGHWIPLACHRKVSSTLLGNTADWPLLHDLLVEALVSTKSASPQVVCSLLLAAKLAPEFLAGYYISLIAVLPVKAVKLKNILLCAAPRQDAGIRRAEGKESALSATEISALCFTNQMTLFFGKPVDLVALSDAYVAKPSLVIVGRILDELGSANTRLLLDYTLFLSVIYPAEVGGRGASLCLQLLEQLIVEASTLLRLQLLSALVSHLRYPNRVTLRVLAFIAKVFSGSPGQRLGEGEQVGIGGPGGQVGPVGLTSQRLVGDEVGMGGQVGPMGPVGIGGQVGPVGIGGPMGMPDPKYSLLYEHIALVLLERLVVAKPHPWGVVQVFLQLVRTPRYDFYAKVPKEKVERYVNRVLAMYE